MNHARVKAKVIGDSTGIQVQIPVILVEKDGQCLPLEPLVDYLLEMSGNKSRAWMNKLCQIVEMLLDYMDANHGQFDKPVALFETFAKRVYSGTIGEEGRDPSGLYWLNKNISNAKQLLMMLSEFSDWMHGQYGTEPLNPWREATGYEQRLNWAAFINKSKRSFLGHLDSYADAAEAAKQARNVLHPRQPTGDSGEVKAFPDDRFLDLLFVGFTVPGKENSPDIVERYDWRGICITILMHWGGLRVSEPFHLWVGDVMPDLGGSDQALVRVFHPIEGAAPKDRRGPDGRFLANRAGYLKLFHPGYRPRHKESGNRFAGWKNPKLDDTQQNCMQVHWLPAKIAAKLFMQAYRLYMYQRMRARIGSEKHPFLFVSFRAEQHGEPYTIDAYGDAHKRAVRRIGMLPAKLNGTTEHGHRHAYGRRTQRGEVGEIVTQRGLHHISIESQGVYTEPSIGEVTAALERAAQALDSGEALPMVEELDAFMTAERKELKRYQIQRRK